ncbi:MAG: hypothetical protein K2H78_00145 [Clostridia bacterium]|nr:hypothetical protein [Clostridia bacterium]
MKICVVTDRRKQLSVRLPPCDVVLFGFGTLGLVDYESELNGKTEKFETAAKLSHAAHCGVLCGCITDSRGLMRKSVAVASNGKLLGISDMLNVLDGEEYKSGANVGVYTIGGYKVGVCIDNDLYFPDCVKACAMCGCNLLVVHAEDVTDGIPPLLIRAYAYLYGMPVVLCAGSTAFFADISGVIASSNQDIAVFETSPKNCYRKVTSRVRGLFSDSTADF